MNDDGVRKPDNGIAAISKNSHAARACLREEAPDLFSARDAPDKNNNARGDARAAIFAAHEEQKSNRGSAPAAVMT
jgi:hypothetical protein